MVTHQTPEAVLRTYLRSKDENRPHLTPRVFTDDAVLHVHLRTGSIAFPSVTRGRCQITDVLVSSFAMSYENVYTYCMARPADGVDRYACDWMVVMTEKTSGSVRVGCGRYDWGFDAARSGLADRLVITIEQMLALPPAEQAAVFRWVDTLAYPWTTPAQVAAGAPDIAPLAPVLQYLAGAEARDRQSLNAS